MESNADGALRGLLPRASQASLVGVVEVPADRVHCPARVVFGIVATHAARAVGVRVIVAVDIVVSRVYAGVVLQEVALKAAQAVPIRLVECLAQLHILAGCSVVEIAVDTLRALPLGVDCQAVGDLDQHRNHAPAI